MIYFFKTLLVSISMAPKIAKELQMISNLKCACTIGILMESLLVPVIMYVNSVFYGDILCCPSIMLSLFNLMTTK